MDDLRNASLSHGTHRNEDLLQAFASKLETLAGTNTDHATAKHHADLASEAFGLIEAGNDETDSACEVVAELFDALDSYSPNGCSFGAHPGDGSDFGWWEGEEDQSGELLG